MSGLTRVVLILLAIGLIGGLVYTQMSRQEHVEMEQILEQEKKELSRELEGRDKQIAELQEEVALHKETVLPRETLEKVFGEDAEEVAAASEDRSCEELDSQVSEFFSYLDKQSYVEEWKLAKGAHAFFLEMVVRVSEHLPIVSGETKDPTNLMNNVVHFYRVMGKKEVKMARQILVSESEVIEPVSALYYEWFMARDKCRDGMPGRPSFKVMYEYGAYFLNTLAGKSYLLRRESRLRTLVTYYCILILDQANQQTLNRHGLDIRPLIVASSEDIRNQSRLANSKQYLDRLEEIGMRYETVNGEE